MINLSEFKLVVNPSGGDERVWLITPSDLIWSTAQHRRRHNKRSKAEEKTHMGSLFWMLKNNNQQQKANLGTFWSYVPSDFLPIQCGNRYSTPSAAKILYSSAVSFAHTRCTQILHDEHSVMSSAQRGDVDDVRSRTWQMILQCARICDRANARPICTIKPVLSRRRLAQ